ncbi:hypothetical protein OSH08_17830 [Kaistia geumhonensis]|uniref:Uncharacterized protein n=1 Tax=Kaistia geumhonensis TaxID=410839 RepID=A0ABU0M8Y5_9HYPH|nr:hypothetical protein [Kaistia geumhonensis]MCX5480865.1 hypothetical protein [Kaistia geumhonensis]MDQ0517431.1 hypothetical protein [Kaistia geumhonensis]
MVETDDDDVGMRRGAEEIGARELDKALRGLTLFGDDIYLGMQATNVALVDVFLMQMETEAREYRSDDEGINLEHAVLLNALSQQWLFAVYELLRTWRERAKSVLKWHSNGGLKLKAEALEKRRNPGDLNLGRDRFAQTIRKIIDHPKITKEIADDLARTHVLFRQLEFLRVALAKHEVSGQPKLFARAPGYARIDMWTGSMSYELSNDFVILGQVTRRSFADGIRALSTDRTVPSKEDIAAYEAFMALKPDDVPDFGKAPAPKL